mgnify:CR=1 FL=1
MLVHSVVRKLAAILAADVIGYSQRMGKDKAGTLARLKEHRREVIDPKISEHRGRRSTACGPKPSPSKVFTLQNVEHLITCTRLAEFRTK